MSAAKRKQIVTDDHSETDEENDVDEDNVNDVVQYLLIMDRKKLPIKRSDIVKNALRNENRKFNLVFPEAKQRLNDVFGIKVQQVTDKSNISYILISTLDESIFSLERSMENDLLNGILLPVLSVIFMNEGEVKEEIIWNFLSTLGYHVDDKAPLPGIGVSLRDLLTNVWVKQLYLTYTKVTTSEVTEHIFKWGFRSQQQISKMLILEFVCSIFGDNMKPKNWKIQYQEAMNQAEIN